MVANIVKDSNKTVFFFNIFSISYSILPKKKTILKVPNTNNYKKIII